jgi:hypothetical protein
MPTERIAAAFALFAVGGLDHLAAVTSDEGTERRDASRPEPDIVVIPEPAPAPAGESASST